MMIRPCKIDFLFSVTCVHAKKIRHIEPFYAKINMPIFFIYYWWKKEHFSYISISIIFFNKYSNKLYNGVQNLILLFCLKCLLQLVWNEIFQTLLDVFEKSSKYFISHTLQFEIIFRMVKIFQNISCHTRLRFLSETVNFDNVFLDPWPRPEGSCK